MREDWIYFAIGDVHGELSKLADLHAAIFYRIASEKKPARIIHLGDYVDRGPDSRGVVERIMELQASHPEGAAIEVHALMGNHEALMVAAFLADDEASRETWLINGGIQTVDSYFRGEVPDYWNWRDRVPDSQIAWLRDLPTQIIDPDRRLAFVHAGIDPHKFPDCGEEIRLWTRSRKFLSDGAWPERPELDGFIVIHGHTPTDNFRPHYSPRRINVDTGACFGGPLTAVMLKHGEAPQFLRASA